MPYPSAASITASVTTRQTQIGMLGRVGGRDDSLYSAARRTTRWAFRGGGGAEAAKRSTGALILLTAASAQTLP